MIRTRYYIQKNNDPGQTCFVKTNNSERALILGRQILKCYYVSIVNDKPFQLL